jgi:hypothetical protein
MAKRATSAHHAASMASLADVFVPPVPGLDFFHLGGVEGFIAVAAALIGSALVYQWLKKKIKRGFALAIALGLFLAADCTAYTVGRASQRAYRERERLEAELGLAARTSARPSASPAHSSAGSAAPTVQPSGPR